MLVSRILMRRPTAACLLLPQHKMANQISTSPKSTTDRKMTKYQPVTHVIFDMDGLLLDTVHLYEVVRSRILAEFGHEYDFQCNIRSQGLLSQEVAKMIVQDFSLPITPEEYSFRASRIGAEVFANSQLMPDTEIIYEKIISQIATKYGKSYTSDIKLKVLGTNEQTTAATVVSLCGLPITDQDFLKEFRALQNQELGKCGVMEGAERLVRHLHTKKVPIAVATSSGTESVKVKTKNFQELFGLFHHIVMGSSDPEVKNGKPAPDIFRVCASRFDDKPTYEKCLVFEDAPNGVTGATAANMQTVMVPDPSLPPERTAQATQVIKSLIDFKPEDFGLPPF